MKNGILLASLEEADLFFISSKLAQRWDIFSKGEVWKGFLSEESRNEALCGLFGFLMVSVPLLPSFWKLNTNSWLILIQPKVQLNY